MFWGRFAKYAMRPDYSSFHPWQLRLKSLNENKKLNSTDLQNNQPQHEQIYPPTNLNSLTQKIR
jgi:hypothetical protein